MILESRSIVINPNYRIIMDEFKCSQFQVLNNVLDLKLRAFTDFKYLKSIFLCKIERHIFCFYNIKYEMIL